MTKKSLRIGVVGLPDAWSTDALLDAVEKATGERILIDLSRCTTDLSQGKAMQDGLNICDLDGLIVKKLGLTYNRDMLDRLEVLRFIQSCGVRVFSKPESIIRLLDRLSCTVTLRNAGIPLPETTITEDVHLAVETIQRYGEAVLKPLFSTKARGMELLFSDDKLLEQKVLAFKNAPNPVMYIQKKVEIPGRDLGLVFLGGKHIGTYARVKDSRSWNTTTRDGGHYEPHESSNEIIDLAYRAQALFDLDLTSVDIVDTVDGPIVFEVSAFGGFRGMKDALNLNAAELYTDYVLKELTK